MTNFFIFLRRSLQLAITLISLFIATLAILLCLAMAGCPIVQAEPFLRSFLVLEGQQVVYCYDPLPVSETMYGTPERYVIGNQVFNVIELEEN